MTVKTAIAAPEEFWAEAEFLGRSLMGQMEYFEALGITEVSARLAPPPPRQPDAPAAPSTTRLQAPAGPVPPARRRPAAKPSTRPAAPEAWTAGAADLADLSASSTSCEACGFSAEGRPPVVLDRGASMPLMVFVGYGPEVSDGETGALMKRIVKGGFKLNESEYRITSLVKCRFPAGEDGPAQAPALCYPILRRELELLAPKVILAFGQSAGRWLTGLDDHLGLLRPRTYTLDWLAGALLKVTYDLRDMAVSVDLKKSAWLDYQKMIPYINSLRQL